MTEREFLNIYTELAEHFGQISYSAKRGSLIFEQIKVLDAHWFQRVAHKMIIANDGRFDIYAAARREIGDRMERKKHEDASAYRKVTRQMSEMGMDKLLEKLESKSIWEAVKKNTAGGNNESR